MSDNTIIQQGYFTSTGASKTIQLRSGIDWMRIINYTVAGASQTTGLAVDWYWQLGMGSTGIVTYKTDATNASNLVQVSASGTFTYIDTSVDFYGVIQATVTAISTAAIPVVTNSGTNGLVAGSVVRLLNVAGAPQLGGMDFTVGNNTLSSTTFSLDYMSQLSVAGTTASFMPINFDPIYYPRRRYITKITKAAQAVVTLSVTHGYQVGQLIRMSVPAAYGMVEMNNLQATIVSVNTTAASGNTITLDVNSSSFNSFVFPLAAAVAFTPAQVIPVGEDTAEALSQSANILSDATVNQSYIGMKLSSGPSGSSGDVMYWTAGKSFSNNGL